MKDSNYYNYGSIKFQPSTKTKTVDSDSTQNYHLLPPECQYLFSFLFQILAIFEEIPKNCRGGDLQVNFKSQKNLVYLKFQRIIIYSKIVLLLLLLLKI